jgi:NAD(P)H-hydrate epimerase
MQATETVTLGFPKIGLFSKAGWELTGKLHIQGIGLSALQAKPVAWIPKIEDLKLPSMHRSQHKYERGLVIGLGGSQAYKGAVKLSGTAALHAGAGIVKLFTLEDVGPMADELIAQVWDIDLWKEAQPKASSYFVGPGLSRSKAARHACKAALQSLDKPSVLDGDALYFLPEFPIPAQCILTPHQGEMMHLLGASHLEEAELWDRCQAYVQKHAVVLVLKGSPTRIFSSDSVPILIPRGDPGMATAGSGDVLTGILAALLAQGQSLLEASVLGVTLHALAGEAAARDKTSYGYTAHDLIDYLPSALKQVDFYQVQPTRKLQR